MSEEPHYKTFGMLKKPGPGQSNELKTEIYDSWMRWIEGQEQGDLTAEDFIIIEDPPRKMSGLWHMMALARPTLQPATDRGGRERRHDDRGARHCH